MTNKQHQVDDWDNEEPVWQTILQAVLMALMILLMLAIFIPRIYAQNVCDTIPIQNEYILNIHQIPSKNGKSIKYYVVYKYNGEKDVTTISKSVVEYIQTCRRFGVAPKLAIRTKNGEIVSIIKRGKK